MKFTLLGILSVWLVSTPALAQIRPTYTMPAEWEPQDAVWMGLRTEETQRRYDTTTVEMIRALAPFVKVNLILEKDTLFREGKSWFTQFGIDTSRISIIRQDPTDYWYRDPGPVFVRNAEGQLAVVDFRYSNYGSHPDSLTERARQHDGIDRDVAHRLKLPIITSSVLMEGGAIEVNGKGTLRQLEFVTLQRNPHLSKEAIEQDLKRVLGVKKVIWLKKGPADDDRLGLLGDSVLYGVRGTGGHVDEFCRLANASTILLGWIDEDEIGSDPVRRIAHDRMVENLKILQQATDQDGKPFTIIKVPFPRIDYTKRVVTESSRYYQNINKARPNVKAGTILYIVPSSSYLNYVITNGLVLLPAYWQPGMTDACKKRDAQVLALFKKHFPNRKLVMINPLISITHRAGCIALPSSNPLVKDILNKLAMKRRNFVKSSLAAPLLADSPTPADDRTKKAVFVAAGKNRVAESFGAGQPNLLKLSGKDTNGDLCIFETTVNQKGGPPLHVHHAVDEWFYILEGEFAFQIGKETFRLKAGDCILGPRGVPHTLAHVSEGVGKLTIVFQPAGQMEDFFIGSGKRQRRPTAEESQAHFRVHGMEIVGPPLPIE